MDTEQNGGQTTDGSPDEPKGGVGPMVGAIIIIVLLIVGALYFWGGKLNKEKLGDTGSESATAATANIDESAKAETGTVADENAATKTGEVKTEKPAGTTR